MDKSIKKNLSRAKRVKRIRKNVCGSSLRPRLSVHRSARHIYAQIIDDSLGHTIVSVCSNDNNLIINDNSAKCDVAKQVGVTLAIKAVKAGIQEVVFDRGGNLYHGRIKSLADGAREGGLVF